MRTLRGAACGLAAALALGLAPGALADGDPASDVLYTEDVYLPYTPKPSTKLSGQLIALLHDARTAGYGMKVALIESRADLGAYPNLFRQPQKYADLLSSEITYGARKPHLLVVMPNGFGAKRLPKGYKQALRDVHINAAGKSNGLVSAAIRAVRKLAAAAGHRI